MAPPSPGAKYRIPDSIRQPCSRSTGVFLLLTLLEHERCHGRAAQAADGSGRQREVHGGASFWIHPGVHRVRSAGHPPVPRLAGGPTGENEPSWCAAAHTSVFHATRHHIIAVCDFSTSTTNGHKWKKIWSWFSVLFFVLIIVEWSTQYS